MPNTGGPWVDLDRSARRIASLPGGRWGGASGTAPAFNPGTKALYVKARRVRLQQGTRSTSRGSADGG